MNAYAPSPGLGLGLYPLREAARLAHLDSRTARRWAEGYHYIYRGERRPSPGVLGQVGGSPDLTFAEMLTLLLVRGFRGAGLSLRTIKRAAAIAAAEFGTSTPFVTQRFRTDGRKVFLELVEPNSANDEPELPQRDRKLIDVVTRQREFADIVEPSLFQNVEWQDDIATRWWPLGKARAVVLEPTTLFGAPHVLRTRVPTEVIAGAVQAEGGSEQAVALAAEWYGVSIEQVRDAVQFETVWLRPAA